MFIYFNILKLFVPYSRQFSKSCKFFKRSSQWSSIYSIAQKCNDLVNGVPITCIALGAVNWSFGLWWYWILEIVIKHQLYRLSVNILKLIFNIFFVISFLYNWYLFRIYRLGRCFYLNIVQKGCFLILCEILVSIGVDYIIMSG